MGATRLIISKSACLNVFNISVSVVGKSTINTPLNPDLDKRLATALAEGLIKELV